MPSTCASLTRVAPIPHRWRGRAKMAMKLPRLRYIRMRVLPRAGVDRHCDVRSSPHYLRKRSFSSTRCGYIYLFTIVHMVTADERNFHGLVAPVRTINSCCGLFIYYALQRPFHSPRCVCVSTVQNHDHLYVELYYSLLFWPLPKFGTARCVPKDGVSTARWVPVRDRAGSW